MKPEGDILELLRIESAEALRRTNRALIVQPGAIGDCLLTLPLVHFLKDVLQLGKVDMLGHTEYTGILPGRTCLDSVISIDSMDLHRLFVEPDKFNPADKDPLINAFSGYSWISTFLGGLGSNFEQNLIFTANCSFSTEVITLELKPPKDFSGHIADYYIEQFIDQSNLTLPDNTAEKPDYFIKHFPSDILQGRELLSDNDIDSTQNLIIIHPGSGGKNKCWHLDNFLAVAKKLISDGNEVVFLLGPAEKERFSSSKINKISKLTKILSDLTLNEVLCILSCTNAFIGNDSGITHLAAMLGINTFVVFGPTSEAVYKPLGPNVTTFRGGTDSGSMKPSEELQEKMFDALNSKLMGK